MQVDVPASSTEQLTVQTPALTYGAWYAVGMLTLVNAVNYMDRMAISALLPDIQRDLALSDTSLGVLTGYAFALFYATAGLPLARLADRSSRRNVIGLSLVAWSVFTAATGAVQNFWQLFCARVAIAAGEAGCIPASQAFISDAIPARRRARALGIHTSGAAIGALLGLVLGGWFGTEFGWRRTFAALGAIGLALSVCYFLTVRDVRAAASTSADLPAEGSLLATLQQFWRSRAFVILQVVFALGMLSEFALAMWLPTFYRRCHDLSAAQAGLWTGLAFGGGSCLGALIGGWWSDRLITANLRNSALIIGALFTLAAPLYAAAVLVSSAPLSIWLYALGAVIFAAAFPAIYTLVQSISAPQTRALAMAITSFFAAVVGTGSGPFLVGLISDFLAPDFGSDSLRLGLVIAALFALLAAGCTRVLAPHLDTDIKRRTA